MRSKYLLIVAPFLLLLSCRVSNHPKAVAEHFIKASAEMDFREARKYATPETAAMLEFVQNITAHAHANTSPLKDIKIEMEEETISGDDARVLFKKEGTEEDHVISLKKIDGRWLVATGTSNREIADEMEAGEEEAADSVAVVSKQGALKSNVNLPGYGVSLSGDSD